MEGFPESLTLTGHCFSSLCLFRREKAAMTLWVGIWGQEIGR